MKRTQMFKKANRNNNSYNHVTRTATHFSSVSPEILVGQIWLQEDEPAPVQIIELNTSDEFEPSQDAKQDNRTDITVSYAERLQQIEDNYKINKKARERRRLNQENHFLSSNNSTNTNNQFTNNDYNLFSDIAEDYFDDSDTILNHKVNCFTIINKHFINSDTSSEVDFADVEIISSNDILTEPNNWDVRRPYNEDTITYDTDLDKEPRTIWIYSFKNKQLLTEDDYEFKNKAAKDTSSCSTSCSIESDEDQTKDKDTNVPRLGSPIPPSYIPRLNLSLGPTLSTVTEVSEPNRQASSNDSYRSPKNKVQKSRNSWFISESDRIDSGRSVRKFEKSTNIVNWMSLSPREKRRRSKDPGDKWEGSLLKLETLATEETENNQHQTNYKPMQENGLRLQVDVDVHVSLNEKTPEKRSLGTQNSDDVIVASNTDIVSINKIKNAEIAFQACVKDRGDHDMKFEQIQQIMCITEPEAPINNVEGLKRLGPLVVFEEPRQKFDKKAFKREETVEKETASYDYLTDKFVRVTDDPNVIDRLWLKNNAPLLKPSEWKEYLPIAESPLSINVSIVTVGEERQPWFKRFIRYIKCCK